MPHWVRWLSPWFILYVLLWHLPGVLPFHPSHWPPPLLALTEISAAAILVGAGGYRYRKASTLQQRQQIKWVIALGTGGLLSYSAANVLLPELFPPFTQDGSVYDMFINPLLSCGVLLIPVSLAIAILRYRLWDIDVIINRTLVYGGLSVGITTIYMLVVVSLEALFRAQGNLLISLLATGLVAVLFQPLRIRLQRAVNRLLYGERDTPYRVISRLGQRLEAALAPEAVLPTIVETVAQALKLPYVAITLQEEREFAVVASYGQSQDELVRLPLSYQAEWIGELLLAPRAPGENFTPADRGLLNDLARQAGIAANTVRLTTDLQRLTGELQQSRTQLITAREEERRRLRRDLHDGLGSMLASLNWRAGAIRTLLARDPAAADTLVAEQQSTIRSAIADIRRLVYELRPPSLDELGLVEAMREHAAHYSTQHGRHVEQGGTNGLEIEVLAPNSLPALPAAVEVAAYRIVQEALVNVTRHAHAHRCIIRLSIEEELLQVEVTDDGVGLQEPVRAGVGLLSMFERAQELGGTCDISPAPGGGIRVRARLPALKE